MERKKVSIRNGFSSRNETKNFNFEIQMNELDSLSRSAIYNFVDKIINFKAIQDKEFLMKNKKTVSEKLDFIMENLKTDKIIIDFVDDVLKDVFYYTTYEIEKDCLNEIDKFKELINKVIKEDEYYDVLTLLEFMVNRITGEFPDNSPIILEELNNLFEKEFIGYRYFNNKIVPISSKEEADTIVEAIENTYDLVKVHLEKALSMISDRENPDYENVIKESISAVEAMSCLILGEKGSLGKTMDKLEKQGLNIHKCLKQAFDKLYGYTSDAKGVRHSGDIGGENSTFEEAKFMLIACSAFINYLKVVSSKVSI